MSHPACPTLLLAFAALAAACKLSAAVDTLPVEVQGDPTSPAAKNAYIVYGRAVGQAVAQSTGTAECGHRNRIQRSRVSCRR